MRTSIEFAIREHQTGAEYATLTLSEFLSASASAGSCFCCGSPTDLMLDGDGLLLLRCPVCGAEIEVEQTVCSRRGEPALQAA
jgi:hypothetical protein